MARKKAWSGWGRPMQRVAGWDFDHRLNGYVTTAADRFACECGDEFDTPSGYRKCGSCGRAWNSYVIGTDGHGREASLEKVICREIPVRKDVIVASKRPRKAKWLGPIDFGGKMNNHDNYAYSDDDDRFMGPTESVVSYPPELTPAGHGTRPRMKRTKVKNPEDYPPPRGEGRHRAEARRRQAGIECVNGCGNLKAPPAIDWSMSKGIPFDMNTKWQYYYETGGDHPHNYDEDFEIPGNWDSFNSWHGSGYCQDCHPYKNGHPNPEHPGYNKWLQDNRSHPGRDEPDEKRSGWDPDKDQDPFDPRLIGASRRQAKGDCECWDGYERVPGTKPCAKGSCRKKAALRYVAWCRQVGRRPSPAGLRRFKVAERIVRHADRHNLRRKDLAELEAEQEPEEDVSIEHFSSRRTAASYEDWAREKGYKPGGPHDENERMHWHYDTGTGDPEDWEGVPKEWGEFNNWKPKKKAIRRRRAELFDITEEGETRKGKGKTDTPTMRKNPKDWTDRRQNGQYTKRWN